MIKQNIFKNLGVKAFGMLVIAFTINSCGPLNNTHYGENDGIYYDPSSDQATVNTSNDNGYNTYSEEDYVYQGDEQNYNNQIYNNLYSGSSNGINYDDRSDWFGGYYTPNIFLNIGLGGFGLGYGNWMFGFNNWGMGSPYYFSPFFYNNPYYMMNPYFYNFYNYYGRNYIFYNRLPYYYRNGYSNRYFNGQDMYRPYFDTYERRRTNSIGVNSDGTVIERRRASANVPTTRPGQNDLNRRNVPSPNYGRDIQNPNISTRPTPDNVERVPIVRPARPDGNSVQPRPTPRPGNQIDRSSRNSNESAAPVQRIERRSNNNSISRPPSPSNNMSRPAPSAPSSSNSVPERSSRRL